MAWWNPKSWFNTSTDPAATVALPRPPEAFLWVETDPNRSGMGIDFYSDAQVNPYEFAIKVTGLSMAEARTALVGKVLNWAAFTDEELDGIQTQNPPPTFSPDELKAKIHV